MALRKDMGQHLTAITGLLRAGTGHDFSGYKEGTLTRRIQRRMQVLHIDDVPGYVERLKTDRGEQQALFHELLIGVTQFFRDPDAFEALKSTVLAPLISSKAAGEPIRIWAPGCATGEEVYSIAILLSECMTDSHRAQGSDIKIFGTDIDDGAIAIARSGSYRQPVTGVSPERLERWFVKEGNDHRLRPEIRQLCAFSVHSIVKDPPFSRLDLISCRNVLIYLDKELQDRAVQTCHYALNPGGFLFLGASERIMRQARYFAIVDDKHRIFQRRDTGALLLPSSKPSAAGLAPLPLPRPTRADEDRIDKSARRVMEQYAPAYFVVDRQHQILRFSGSEARHYLEPSPGAANLNLFTLLQKTLRPAVRSAVEQAFTGRKAVVNGDLTIQIDGKSRSLMLIVEPILSNGVSNLCVVAFRDTSPLVRAPVPEAASATDAASTLGLEEELRATKAQLQAATDQLESYIEDMKSTTEDYQAVTEELQSSNEELETAKEELQSINEELQTVNGELQSKNDAMERLNSDLKNLLDSTQIATVFLDDALRVKHYTPAMAELFPLRDADRGRPITEVVSQLAYDALRADVQDVQHSLRVVERELDLKGGRCKLPDAHQALPHHQQCHRRRRDHVCGHHCQQARATGQGAVHRRAPPPHPQPSWPSCNRFQTRRLPQPARSRTYVPSSTTGCRRLRACRESCPGGRALTLRELVQGELAAVGVTPGSERVVVDGPPVTLPHQTMQLLALALHELATNALKHGALKDSRGRIDVRWQMLDPTDTPRLELIWVESGRKLDEPEANSLDRGFGRDLLEHALPYQLDATTKLDVAQDGIRFSAVIPWYDDERREL